MKKELKFISYIVIFDICFVIIKLIANSIRLEYMQWIYKIVLAVNVISLIVGIVKIIIKTQNKVAKVILSVIMILFAIGALFLFQIILLMYLAFFPAEHIVTKNDTLMVGYVYGFMRTRVDYYDYKNLFFRSNIKTYSEDYGRGSFNPFESEHEVQEYNYYDEKGNFIYSKDSNGNIIKNNNENSYNTESNTVSTNNIEPNDDNSFTMKENDILYEKTFNENSRIRVVYKGSVLGQRSIIEIEKTNDNGNSWINPLEMADGFIQIHNNSKFVFIDENIGFINDPGLVGTNNEHSALLVTVDGGKTFVESKIIHPDIIKEENLLVSDVPYIENDLLKLKIYTINYNKNPSETYYEFLSTDNGLTWEYIKNN